MNSSIMRFPFASMSATLVPQEVQVKLLAKFLRLFDRIRLPHRLDKATLEVHRAEGTFAVSTIPPLLMGCMIMKSAELGANTSIPGSPNAYPSRFVPKAGDSALDLRDDSNITTILPRRTKYPRRLSSRLIP